MFQLPAKESIWDTLVSFPVKGPSSKIMDSCTIEMADHPLQIITSPLGMEDFAASPINKANKVQWTAEQRERVSYADHVTTLSE